MVGRWVKGILECCMCPTNTQGKTSDKKVRNNDYDLVPVTTTT